MRGPVHVKPLPRAHFFDTDFFSYFFRKNLSAPAGKAVQAAVFKLGQNVLIAHSSALGEIINFNRRVGFHKKIAADALHRRNNVEVIIQRHRVIQPSHDMHFPDAVDFHRAPHFFTDLIMRHRVAPFFPGQFGE